MLAVVIVRGGFVWFVSFYHDRHDEKGPLRCCVELFSEPRVVVDDDDRIDSVNEREEPDRLVMSSLDVVVTRVMVVRASAARMDPMATWPATPT